MEEQNKISQQTEQVSEEQLEQVAGGEEVVKPLIKPLSGEGGEEDSEEGADSKHHRRRRRFFFHHYH
ncbi:MAG: hypothetical protein AAGF01_30200 [Cyanobacteria bacterium P01_G01_bin.38]